MLPIGNGCSCSDCRNFEAASDVAFPSDFRAVAAKLGIDVTKPVELCHYCTEETGLHYTGGWFHVVGRILAGADAMKPTGPNSWTHVLERLPSAFEFGFTEHLALVAEPFKSHQIIQLEFATRMPWLINDPESP